MTQIYKLTSSKSILRVADNTYIPPDLANNDYVKYLSWTALGNTADAADSPTATQLITSITDALQLVLDMKAQERGYSDIKSACAYASQVSAVPSDNFHFTTCEKFRIEGNSLQTWMSLVWATAYAYLATVTSGTNIMPTPTQAIAMMPVFAWTD